MKLWAVTWPWGLVVVRAADADEAIGLAADVPSGEGSGAVGWAEVGADRETVDAEELLVDGEAAVLGGRYG